MWSNAAKTLLRYLPHGHVPVIVDAASEYDLQTFLTQGADIVIYSAINFWAITTSGIIAGQRSLVKGHAQIVALALKQALQQAAKNQLPEPVLNLARNAG
ncbi:MAG: hypothetical protein COB13_005760, partial [OCS116 cluster bacterium]|nr:hypothetical protein [OCS116 cluster bacterium]